MTRKIDFSRVYRVIRTIILVVCIPALIYGLWALLIGVGKFEKYGEMCRAINDTNCSLFNDKASDLAGRGLFFLFVGLGLPVFFGGKWLINYIAPTIKKNK